MIKVDAVKLRDLCLDELKLLVKYKEKCFEHVRDDDLVHKELDGTACVYRISGDIQGIMILSLGNDGIYIDTVAGKNIVANFAELYKKIKVIAAASGARRLYSFVDRPGLARVYDRQTNSAPVATLYREEL